MFEVLPTTHTRQHGWLEGVVSVYPAHCLLHNRTIVKGYALGYILILSNLHYPPRLWTRVNRKRGAATGDQWG